MATLNQLNETIAGDSLSLNPQQAILALTDRFGHISIQQINIKTQN